MILISTSAKVLRRSYSIPARDLSSNLSTIILIAVRDVLAASNRLRSIHRIIPIGKVTTCRSARGRSWRVGCRRPTRSCRAGRIGFRLLGIHICHELGVIVVAFDIEGGENGFFHSGGESVAFCSSAGIEEIQGGVLEIDGEGVVG